MLPSGTKRRDPVYLLSFILCLVVSLLSQILQVKKYKSFDFASLFSLVFNFVQKKLDRPRSRKLDILIINISTSKPLVFLVIPLSMLEI